MPNVRRREAEVIVRIHRVRSETIFVLTEPPAALFAPMIREDCRFLPTPNFLTVFGVSFGCLFNRL